MSASTPASQPANQPLIRPGTAASAPSDCDTTTSAARGGDTPAENLAKLSANGSAAELAKAPEKSSESAVPPESSGQASGPSALLQWAASQIAAHPPASEEERRYRACVAELQELAKKGKYITQDWILKVAAMAPDDMRRRLVVNYEWHRTFAACLDAIPALRAMPGAAPDGCWGPDEIRAVVMKLLAECPLTWEHSYLGTPKNKPESAPPGGGA